MYVIQKTTMTWESSAPVPRFEISEYCLPPSFFLSQDVTRPFKLLHLRREMYFIP